MWDLNAVKKQIMQILWCFFNSGEVPTDFWPVPIAKTIGGTFVLLSLDILFWWFESVCITQRQNHVFLLTVFSSYWPLPTFYLAGEENTFDVALALGHSDTKWVRSGTEEMRSPRLALLAPLSASTGHKTQKSWQCRVGPCEALRAPTTPCLTKLVKHFACFLTSH